MPSARDIKVGVAIVGLSLIAVWAVNHFGNNLLVKKTTA